MKKWIFLMAAVLVMLLSGCSMQAIDEMYQLPKRSDEFTNLQSVINNAMAGMEYSAPIAGENQQTVQTADLDGDGVSEHILFAKGTSEKPLQIFIFTGEGGNFRLLDSIECNGTAFEQVEYVPLNDAAGYELVVGRQVSDQVLRSVSVYTLANGQIEQLMTTSYARYLCSDLQGDSLNELFVLRPGESDWDNGVAELYSFQGESVKRYPQVNMSAPADKIKRITIGKLEGGHSAMFVASTVEQNAIVTDVFAVVGDELTNVSRNHNPGTGAGALRNYFVYATDIDEDGILELPALITMKVVGSTASNRNQYLIRWYSLTPDGQMVIKKYTYHNYDGGWYLELDSSIAEYITVTQKGNGYVFSLWDPQFISAQDVMSVYVLTGPKREEQAVEANRFVIYRSESTVFSAKLEVTSAAIGMTKESITSSFHLILQDRNPGET